MCPTVSGQRALRPCSWPTAAKWTTRCPLRQNQVRWLVHHQLAIRIRQFVMARTNASEPKLERLLYYENTKLRRRKRGHQDQCKQISRVGRQGASSGRANRKVWQNTEDCAKRDFSFLFRKSAGLVPRPHQKYQIFYCRLVNSNSTPTFWYNLLTQLLAISSIYLLCFIRPKMPYYSLTTKAQAVVMRALSTPLKAITQVTGISTKHVSNLLKRAVKNSWHADWVLLNNYFKNKPRQGHKKKITPNLK